MSLAVDIARTAPRSVEAIGIPVATEGAVPRSLGMSRAALAANGFEGKPGQTLVLPSGTGPTMIAVGTGPAKEITANGLRNAAAALARASSKRATGRDGTRRRRRHRCPHRRAGGRRGVRPRRLSIRGVEGGQERGVEARAAHARRTGIEDRRRRRRGRARPGDGRRGVPRP